VCRVGFTDVDCRFGFWLFGAARTAGAIPLVGFSSVGVFALFWVHCHRHAYVVCKYTDQSHRDWTGTHSPNDYAP